MILHKKGTAYELFKGDFVDLVHFRPEAKIKEFWLKLARIEHADQNSEGIRWRPLFLPQQTYGMRCGK